MGSDSPAVFLLFAVVGALVLGTATGASGKGEMMRLHNQSDVERVGELMIGARTMQVQVTALLLTDSVANAVSAHESSGMRVRALNSLM